MIWDAGGYSRGFRLSFLVFGSLLLSACVSQEAREKGLAHYDKYDVSAPVLDDIEGLKEIRESREKVTRIDVAAPIKGDRLLSKRIRQRSDRDALSSGADYLLAEDMAPAVRKASEYLFERDPKAEKIVKIVMTVDTLSELYVWKECAPWATDVTVRFQVTDVPIGGAETTTSHEVKERSFSCPRFSSFPSSESVEEALQKAFSRALLEMVKARRAGEGATLPAN